MSIAQRAPPANRLLAALPDNDRRRILAGCETVHLAFADVLYTPGEAIDHVYFPTESFISLIMPIDDSASLEVGMVGDEGMFGVPLALDVDISPVRAVVQGEGPALRMDAVGFRRELARSAALRHEIDLYVFVRMAQLAQTAGCTRFHVVEARLARWLLMTRDRVRSGEFRMTHEFLSHMLGVRRVGVTEAASALQRRKLIEYTRGHIRILNHRGLQDAACACYEGIKD